MTLADLHAQVTATIGAAGAWYENPLLTAVVGATVGALAALGTGSLLGRRQRRHDRELAEAAWARQDAEQRAVARQQRFDVALTTARLAAQDSADTARSLRVLAALLAGGDELDTAATGLPLRATWLEDAGLRAQVDEVAEVLVSYRVGHDQARAVAVARLRAAVPELATLVQAEAGARAEDLTVLSTSGRSAVEAEVDALRRRPGDPGGRPGAG